MARTNEVAVRAILDTDLDAQAIQAFIDDASAWVTDELSTSSLGTARLTMIEKYLAAHFCTLRDPRLKSGRLGDVQETYQRDGEVSEYLKHAASLDSTGAVQDAFLNVDERHPVVFEAGTTFQDETALYGDEA